MRQAIQTKYLAPTNHRGARIKAAASGGSVTIPWAYEFDSEHNHWKAAIYLMDKMGWDKFNTLRGGRLPSGDFVFVQVPIRKKVA